MESHGIASQQSSISHGYSHPVPGRAREDVRLGVAEDHMCVCRHSPGAHKTPLPHPCGLCTCDQYRDVATLSAGPASCAMSDETRRALAILAKPLVFQGMPNELLQSLARCGRHRLFLAGAVLMREGAASDYVYVLAKGRVRVERGLGGPRSELLAELGPGELVGEMGVLRNTRRSATVTASDDLETLQFNASDLKSLFREHPHLLMAFAKLMHERIHARQ